MIIAALTVLSLGLHPLSKLISSSPAPRAFAKTIIIGWEDYGDGNPSYGIDTYSGYGNHEPDIEGQVSYKCTADAVNPCADFNVVMFATITNDKSGITGDIIITPKIKFLARGEAIIQGAASSSITLKKQQDFGEETAEGNTGTANPYYKPKTLTWLLPLTLGRGAHIDAKSEPATGEASF
ncbi:hypothetical protein [Armatimonas sp.]|uniref:hypothetical protein n=1 Tax=Armatimonas sp. TaxID=1872638 RepID=UPI0037502901